MNRPYVVVFTIGERVEWSGETHNSLITRYRNEPAEVQAELEDFLDDCKTGYFARIGENLVFKVED